MKALLSVNQPVMNLGTITFGQPHKFKYILTNSGPGTVFITKLVTGCSSCTKASCRKTYLKAGESSEIDVTFTPGITGKQTKTVNVLYNDTEKLLLEFTAEVPPNGK